MVRCGRACKVDRETNSQIGVKSRQCGVIEGRGRNMVSIPKKKRNFQQYEVMLSKEVRRGLNYPLDFMTGRPLVNLMKVLWVERGGGSLNGVNDE